MIDFSLYITTAVATYITGMLGVLMFSSRSSMWDDAYLLFIIPFSFCLSYWVLVSFGARKPGKSIFVSPKRAFQERR